MAIAIAPATARAPGCAIANHEMVGSVGWREGRVEVGVASHSVLDSVGGPVVLSRRLCVEDDGDEDDDGEDDGDAWDPPPQSKVSFCGKPAGVEVPGLTASSGGHQGLDSQKL